MVKDLNGAQDLARLTNTAMPLTAVCAEIHRMMTAGQIEVREEAVQALGRATDGNLVGELLEEIAYHAEDPWVRSFFNIDLSLLILPPNKSTLRSC